MIRNFLFNVANTYNMIAYGGIRNVINYEKGKATEQPWDFLTEKRNDGAFSKLTEGAQESGNSLISLISVICMIVGAIAIIFTGAQLMMTRAAAKKQEAKEHVIWLFLGAILIFGFGAVFLIASLITEGVSNDIR